MHDCECCMTPVCTAGKCPECSDAWLEGRFCDPEQTWHCDYRNGHLCDGTGCDEYGENDNYGKGPPLSAL